MQTAKIVVLLSGGMDSTVVLYEAIERYDRSEIAALTLSYGQRHQLEAERARRIAVSAGVVHQHKAITLPWSSNLTGQATDLSAATSAVVPWRNTIFAMCAAEHALARDAKEIWMGCCAADAAAFPDCRPEWVSQMGRMFDVYGRNGLRIVAPLIDRTKAQIARRAHALGAECWHAMGASWSCYSPSFGDTTRPCGACSACVARANGFAEAALDDPAL